MLIFNTVHLMFMHESKVACSVCSLFTTAMMANPYDIMSSNFIVHWPCLTIATS